MLTQNFIKLSYRLYNQSKLTADKKSQNHTLTFFTLDKIIKETSWSREINLDMSDYLIFKNRQIKFQNNSTIFVPFTGIIVEFSKKGCFQN